MDLEWRGLVREDAGAMARLNSAVYAADGVGELRGELEMERSFDDEWRVTAPVRLGAFASGELVGFGVLFPRVSAPSVHHMLLWGMVHPECRRRGIGAELVRRAVDAAPELNARSFPGARGFVLLELPDAAGTAELARACGFEVEKRSFDMARPLSGEPGEFSGWVDASGGGLRVIPFGAGYVEELCALHNHSFVPDHPGAGEVPAEAWERRFSDPTFVAGLSYLMVASGTGEVVGYVLSNASREREVRLSIIATHRGYRRRGIATALIGAVLGEAVRRGYERATLDVDTENPSGALRIYERAGFAVTDSATTYVRGGLEP